jgi:DNA-binding protein HU-beta
MNKLELVKSVAEKTGLTQAATKDVVDAVLDVITDELIKGEKVTIAGFGTFEVRERAERMGRNPQSGETMLIGASKNVKFKAGKALKDKVNV